MLALAVDHARVRVQFDRPVASFQAVRHRLAEAFVALEALDACLGAAADDAGALSAYLAKAVAGRAARTVATQCQQVLAGIGFTTEHRFHRYLKRVMLLEGIYGSADNIARLIGRGLIDAKAVPVIGEL
jgi:alkylation response protein AidB-like acyl-CoA dehydrogenase